MLKTKAEYLIKGEKPWEAKIFLNNELIAEIKKGKDLDFKLISKDGGQWIMTNKVHGEIRPFSMAVVLEKTEGKEGPKEEVLTIREHLFKHKGKFYMFTNHPEGKPWHEYLSGPRYISRLDNFPYRNLADIDHNIRHRLRRFRGVQVGEASGLGMHRIKVQKELDDIALLIAACSYLIYIPPGW
jgi:hypothetical protein